MIVTMIVCHMIVWSYDCDSLLTERAVVIWGRPPLQPSFPAGTTYIRCLLPILQVEVTPKQIVMLNMAGVLSDVCQAKRFHDSLERATWVTNILGNWEAWKMAHPKAQRVTGRAIAFPKMLARPIEVDPDSTMTYFFTSSTAQHSPASTLYRPL
jgi:hypothetical protein